jgi:hypothetical protein
MSGFYIPSYLDTSDGEANFKALADSFTRNGPIRFKPISGDYTAVPDDSDVVLRCDGTTEITVPADVFGQRNFPTGAQVAVLNYSEKRVVIEPAKGVTINGPERLSVDRWRWGVLVKQNANLWLLSLGNMGGGETKGVPLPPKITKVTALPGAVKLEWSAPVDDGGSPVTQYIVEKSLNEKEWTGAGLTEGGTLTLTTPENPGLKVWFRVKAVNANGVSDPSNIESATPTEIYNEASGGTVNDFFDTKTGVRYRVHTFTSNDVFTVKSAPKPFRIFCQGGGAGGGYGSGGGRGAANDADFTLNVQNYTITVGAAVSGGYSEHTNRDAPGNNGNRSAVESVVSSPGGISRGDFYAAGVTTDISGKSVTYGGAGGRCVINEDRNEGGFPGGGSGGSFGTPASVTGGGGGGCQWSSGGGARGEIIIRYEIAK